MRKGKELIGKPIYGQQDGRQIGAVKDLFVDLDLKLLKGIYLGREGLINRKVQFIAREDITVFGIDAVLTSGSDVASDNSLVPEVDTWLRRDSLIGREVETAGGTKVGTVGDVLFDEQAAVAGVALARVHVAGPIAEKRLVFSSAITETGGREGAMIVDLAKAEQAAPDEAQEQPDELLPAEALEQPDQLPPEEAEETPAEATMEDSELPPESESLA